MKHLEAGCNCGSEIEHQLLVRKVDESMKHEDERARMRQQRNSQFLRAQVLLANSLNNGHNQSQ